MGEPTFAKAVPYFSIDVLGEYFSSSPSSFLSEERRDSAYANMVSWLRRRVARGHTSVFAWNCKSREKLRFPMTTTSVLRHQV